MSKNEIDSSFWVRYVITVAHLPILIFAVGCSRGVDESKMTDINSPHPSFRVAAMHKTAKAGSYENIEKQIELLADEDPAVRFYAIMSLEKLTGIDNDYNYAHDAARRLKAIEKWQKWLEQYNKTSAKAEQ